MISERNGYCTHFFPISESEQYKHYHYVTYNPLNRKEIRDRKHEIGRAVGSDGSGCYSSAFSCASLISLVAHASMAHRAEC